MAKRAAEDTVGARKSRVQKTDWSDYARPPFAKPPEQFEFNVTDVETNFGELLVHGVTEEGASVMVHVRDFECYFYARAHAYWTNSTLCELLSVLQDHGATHIEFVDRLPMVGYQKDTDRFVKIYVAAHSNISKIRGGIETGAFKISGRVYESEVYEANIAEDLRFMVDVHIVGYCWVLVKAWKEPNPCTSRAQYEVICRPTDIHAHPYDAVEWSKVAPLRILSFDTEEAGRKGIFPQADTDPVIQISNIMYEYGKPNSERRVMQCLRPTAPLGKAHMVSNGTEKGQPLVDARMACYATEDELLASWAELVRVYDPDIILGHNIHNHDVSYMIDRAAHLDVKGFPYLGRLVAPKVKIKTKTSDSKQKGARERKEAHMHGRVLLDLRFYYEDNDRSLELHNLNYLSMRFLQETKKDVHHSRITDMFNDNDRTRQELAEYCMRDSELPIMLLIKCSIMPNLIELVRVAGITMNWVLNRGQEIRNISQLLRYGAQEGYIMPTVDVQPSDEKYKGATVKDPEKGFHDIPIATLDFSSLYPSIMQAHNLCYTTLVRGPVGDGLEITETPVKAKFVKSSVRQGLLPRILTELLAARKRAKADLKKETDPFRRAVLDGRQLALKVSANAVYGLTGCTIGKLPCLEISTSVTSYGRQMLDKTQETIEKHYCKANGYEHDSRVIYGDTDSVMIRFGYPDLATVFKLGNEAAELATAQFIKPIKLEFEKVYSCYLLITKKRYAGMKYEKLDEGVLQIKGLISARRDSCPLARRLQGHVLKLIIQNRDVEGAIAAVKQTVGDMYAGKFDLSMFVMTMGLSHKVDDPDGYKTPQMHVEVVKKIKARAPGTEPGLGSRVPYIKIAGTKKDKNHMLGEDPLYAHENGMQPDYAWYDTNKIRNPIKEVFEPILHPTDGSKPKYSISSVDELFVGTHNLTRVQSKTVGGSLGKFVVAKRLCQGCRVVIDKGAVCPNCDKAEVFVQQLSKLRDIEDVVHRTWAECHRCQPKKEAMMACANTDCTLFYRRQTAKKEREELAKQIAYFD